MNIKGFPCGSIGKDYACNEGDLGSIPGLEDPLEEGMATHSILIWGLPCSSAGKESACNAGDLGLIPGLEDPLEEGKAPHSSILAWRILQTV